MFHVRRESTLRVLLCALLSMAGALAPGGAEAQPPEGEAREIPHASLLRTARTDGVPEGFGGAVDRLLRAKLDELGAVQVRGAVALDIADIQLALGCTGETPECLRPVAEQLEVSTLILPNLDRVGRELVLSVARFDASSGALRRVTRRAAGEEPEPQILDAIDGLVRELFDLPPPAPEETTPIARPVEAPVEAPVEEAGGPDLLGPALVMAAGAALMVGGAVSAGLFVGESDAYAAPPERDTDVAERATHRRAAEDLALASNVLFVVGGVAVAAGLTWLLVALLTGGEEETAVVPVLGPNLAGLSVTGRFGGTR